jgi:hypothetical protein
VKALALLLLATAAVHAAGFDRHAAAREVYNDGAKLFVAGKYADAAAKFEAAYQLDGDPSMLFDAAQADRLAGACPPAAAAYRKFLAEGKPVDPAPIERYIAEMDRCAKAADTSDRELAPPRVITVTHVLVDRGKRRRMAGLALGAAGVVALGTGLLLGHDANQLTGERAALCANGCVWGDVSGEAAHLDARGHRVQLAEGLVYAAGAAAIASGIALYLLGRGQEVEITATPGGASVGASWRF